MTKNIVTFFIIAFFVPSVSWACTVPRTGEEYDVLIKVESVGKNTFKATIPKKAGDLNFGADITVGYYPKGANGRFGEYWKEIYEKEKDENYVVTFDLKTIEGYVPFVQIFWYPEYGGLCGAYGKSKDLHIE